MLTWKKLGGSAIKTALVIVALGKLIQSLAKAYAIIKKANHDYSNRD
ncbi:hypothetical protein [Ligilactobacillus hayakitensis]|nr:hypothetical protein [Ligilactobacillus hayakitensis]